MEQPRTTDAFALLRSATRGQPGMIASRLETKARLRYTVAKALAEGRFEFHYQPVVSAADPRRPAFFEMLARLRMPDGELLSPSAFLPYVEEGLLGRAIDRLAVGQALRALAADPGLRLSVNISPRSMGDEGLLAVIGAASRSHPSACGRLIIEITESAAMQSVDQTIDFMNYVRSTGCAFALDDFGAGATAFKYFRDFRFDMVKIDGAFVHGVHAVRDAQVLVECLVKVAQHFEMLIVAERVENPADAEWLRGLGVDCLQGYLYGRPAPKAEMSLAVPAVRLAS